MVGITRKFDHVEMIAAELAQVLLDLAAQLIGPGRGCPLPDGSRAGPDLGDDDQVAWRRVRAPN